MIRVLLADDDHLIRAGLRALLDAEADLTVIGEAADGREAVDRARELPPDVVVMDVRMPRLDGVEATQHIVSWPRRPPAAHLTQREADILRALAEGLSNTEIAGRLWLSPETVKTHIKSILRKLGVRNRTQAVVWAYRTGFAGPAPVEPQAPPSERLRPAHPAADIRTRSPADSSASPLGFARLWTSHAGLAVATMHPEVSDGQRWSASRAGALLPCP